MITQINTAPPGGLRGPYIRAFPDVVGMGSSGIDPDTVGEVFTLDQFPEHTLRRGRTADIAHAHEEHLYFRFTIQCTACNPAVHQRLIVAVRGMSYPVSSALPVPGCPCRLIAEPGRSSVMPNPAPCPVSLHGRITSGTLLWFIAELLSPSAGFVYQTTPGYREDGHALVAGAHCGRIVLATAYPRRTAAGYGVSRVTSGSSPPAACRPAPDPLPYQRRARAPVS